MLTCDILGNDFRWLTILNNFRNNSEILLLSLIETRYISFQNRLLQDSNSRVETSLVCFIYICELHIPLWSTITIPLTSNINGKGIGKSATWRNVFKIPSQYLLAKTLESPGKTLVSIVARRTWNIVSLESSFLVSDVNHRTRS